MRGGRVVFVRRAGREQIPQPNECTVYPYKDPAYNSRLDRPQPQRSITHRTIGVFVVFVFVVARTEIERVETVITRKRPLEVRRSRGTRHPERARARLGASHDRTARDGGSSLRRRAKAGKTNKRTNVRASGQSRRRVSRFTRRLNKIIRTHRRVALDASTRRPSPVGTISGGLDLAGRYRDAGRYGFPSGVSIRPLATRTLGRRIASRVPDDGSGGELSRHLYRSACGYDVCRCADASS